MLTADVEAEVQGESVSREEQQVDAREPEHVYDGQFRYLPADSYTDEGELRVSTQPLSPDARTSRRAVGMVRYAVHGVVTVRLASCMEPWPNPVTFDDLRRKLGGIAKQKARAMDPTCMRRCRTCGLPTCVRFSTPFNTVVWRRTHVTLI